MFWLLAHAIGADPGELADAPEVADVPARVVSAGSVHNSAPRHVEERWTVPTAVVSAIRAVASRPLGERVAVASESFLGLPYLNDAAGEGDVQDPDPPSRYDTFDCLTFVEEVLSLAMASDPLNAPRTRNQFRYRGEASYVDRRHFMEAEWIPDAIANGLLADITSAVGRASTLEKDVSLETWRSWGRRSLFRVPESRLPVGRWALNYLDLDAAVEAAPRIPAGALVVTLRSSRAWVPVVTTHISLVVSSGPTAVMRHATRMGTKKVRDDKMSWYAAHLREYTNWPALGLVVLMPREQGPRVSALAEADALRYR